MLPAGLGQTSSFLQFQSVCPKHSDTIRRAGRNLLDTWAGQTWQSQMQARPMTATNVIDPSHPSQASDLAPEISALIEAALARAAGRATLCRPEAPPVDQSVPEAPLRVPHLTPSKKRSRVVWRWCINAAKSEPYQRFSQNACFANP